jgi:hypothetical protein
VREALAGRSEEFERLSIEMYGRGLSVEIPKAFVDDAGVCCRKRGLDAAKRLWADCQAFASRDLWAHDVVYLFVDRIAERLHHVLYC